MKNHILSWYFEYKWIYLNEKIWWIIL